MQCTHVVSAQQHWSGEKSTYTNYVHVYTGACYRPLLPWQRNGDRISRPWRPDACNMLPIYMYYCSCTTALCLAQLEPTSYYRMSLVFRDSEQREALRVRNAVVRYFFLCKLRHSEGNLSFDQKLLREIGFGCSLWKSRLERRHLAITSFPPVVVSQTPGMTDSHRAV